VCAACYIKGIIENLAAYTAPFQIADAALHLTAVIGDVVAHLKPQKNHHFVRLVMYCIITTCSVEYATGTVVKKQYITSLTKW